MYLRKKKNNFTQYLTDLCFCIFGHVADLILLQKQK